MTDIDTKGGNEPRTDAFADREALDFIRAIVADDLRAGRYQTIVTRFPPEPNGYLHIGHAKAILLSYGIAEETGGRFNLRFDDTNPETEDVSYVNSIVDTVRWLGADFGPEPLFAADYFGQMYDFAEFLVQRGLAYVDSATDEEIREARGTVTEPGRPTAYRDRPIEENLDLFRRMRAGEFPDGAHVLRAKIDLASKNMLMRDPLLYRIRHAHHYRTGDAWCIYPLYDYAHPIEDAIEGITHSLCSLEFDNNRAVYDWVVDHWQDFIRSTGGTPARPHQYEFARGELEYTITSKRKSLQLVKGGYVSGWDDPRMATLAGLRRRGVTPEALRAFWDRMGVAKFNSRIDIAKLEFAIREDLDERAPRVLAVLRPLRVVITNYPEGQTEEFEAPYWPKKGAAGGTRSLPFSRVVYIDRDDFTENPPKGYFRLSPGAEVRLKYAYVVRCDEVIKDDAGEIIELRCSYDPATRGGALPDGRAAVKGVIQWVSAEHGVRSEVRLYDRLFTVPDPEAREGDFKEYLNPQSLVVLNDAIVEPSLRHDPPGSRYQFERVGFFCSDMVESTPDALIFNRTVQLKDSWAKIVEKQSTENAGPKAEKKPKAERAPKERTASSGGTRPEGGMEIVRSPELEAKRARYVDELGLSASDADVLTRDDELAGLFEATVGLGAAPKSVASWIVNVVLLEVKERGITNIAFTPAELRELIALVEDGTISSASGKAVLADMTRGGGSPSEIVERRGLRQVSDPGALAPIVDQVIAANAGKADEYRAGKMGLLGFFVGQVMRQSGGNANPALVSQLVQERLGG